MIRVKPPVYVLLLALLSGCDSEPLRVTVPLKAAPKAVVSKQVLRTKSYKGTKLVKKTETAGLKTLSKDALEARDAL